jgi:hypothetical protein
MDSILTLVLRLHVIDVFYRPQNWLHKRTTSRDSLYGSNKAARASPTLPSESRASSMASLDSRTSILGSPRGMLPDYSARSSSMEEFNLDEPATVRIDIDEGEEADEEEEQ